MTGGPLATEWNVMVDALRSLTPRQGSGTKVKHTPHGVVYSAKYGGGTPGVKCSPTCREYIKVGAAMPFGHNDDGNILLNWPNPPIDPTATWTDFEIITAVTQDDVALPSFSPAPQDEGDCTSETRYFKIVIESTQERWDAGTYGSPCQFADDLVTKTRKETREWSTKDGALIHRKLETESGTVYEYSLSDNGVITETGVVGDYDWDWGTASAQWFDVSLGTLDSASVTDTATTSLWSATATVDGIYDCDSVEHDQELTSTLEVTLSNPVTLADQIAECDKLLAKIDFNKQHHNYKAFNALVASTDQTQVTYTNARTSVCANEELELAYRRHATESFPIISSSFSIFLTGVGGAVTNAQTFAIRDMFVDWFDIGTSGIPTNHCGAYVFRAKSLVWLGDGDEACAIHEEYPDTNCNSDTASGTTTYKDALGAGKNVLEPDDCDYDHGRIQLYFDCTGSWPGGCT